MFLEGSPINREEANKLLKMDAGKNGKKHCRVHTETADDNLVRRRALDKDFGICSDCTNLRILKLNQEGLLRVELRCIEGNSPLNLHRNVWGVKPRCEKHIN